MADRWYFSRERIRNSPSVRDGGIDCAKELGYRQQCANFVQDIGQRLSVSQLCINTSIVYMHRFYMFHSFKQFHRNTMAPCFIFLGAKVEEQPRKLEHVLKVAHKCLHKDSELQLDTQSDEYMQMAQDLIDNESILLQTLGFDLSVEHPHTYVVKCAQMVKAAKELAQTSYFLATNSLHLTTFCIEEKPTVIACVCIYVACKWTSYEIPETHDKKHWWEYMDSNITIEKIGDMSSYFIKILDSCPTRLKKKISTGPVIYKGGTMQPKRDCDGEHGKSDKSVDNNANKTNSKVEGTSSRSGDQRTEKHSAVHSRQPDKQVEFKKESNDGSQNSKKQSKYSTQSEHDKRVLEHHKHHKRKHSDRNKEQSERPKPQDSTVKRPEDMKHEKLDGSELKLSSARPTDGLKPKVSQSGGLSSAAKHILSLPPLHHKHSLPDTEKTSVSESPSKKQKVDTTPTKKHKYDGEISKVLNQTDEDVYSGKISSHKKPRTSDDKHKIRASSEKHESHKHTQKTMDKSSHGQKHSSSHDKHSKEKRLEHFKSLSSHGLGGTDTHSSKNKGENDVSHFKSKEEGSQLRIDQSKPSKSSKQLLMPKKPPSIEKRAHKVSNSTLKKNGHPKKLISKAGSSLKEPLLPPPPPPPSLNVSNILTVQPPLPTEPEIKQKPLPVPAPGPPGYEESVAMQQNYILPDSQIQNSVMQNQIPGQVYSMQHQVTHNQQNPSLVPQDYQQQLFSSGAQSIISSSNTLSTPQLYYQGQEGNQGATSDVSQAYWQSINNTSLFSPPSIGLLPQPPVPPQGLVIHQVDGLPPPPPLNLPPFPPPQT